VNKLLNVSKLCTALILCIIIFTRLSVIVHADETVSESPKQDKSFIGWSFYTYSEPNFTAKKVGSFSPQTVNIIEKNENNWALITTYSGDSWVYLNRNLLFVDRRMGIFENIADEEPITTIAPQTVEVLEYRENRLLISTWLGPKWIDLNYKHEPSIKDIKDFMSKYNNNISVYYENIETGYTYSYNADKMYFSASVIKAPYAMYVYRLAEKGEANLENLYTYERGDYHGGSGIIKDMNYGVTFSENELLTYSIIYSDNVAFKKILNLFGVDGFKGFVSELGANPNLINKVLYVSSGAEMSANEAGIYAKAIYEYIEGGHLYSEQFKNDLMSTTKTLIESDFPVARKYGQSGVLHEMAVVYSDSPYILAIMTNPANEKAFGEISTAFQNFNEINFVQ